jgi:hypothetical protein
MTASLLAAVAFVASTPTGAGSARAADLSGPPPQYDQGYDEGYDGRGGDRYAPDDDAGPPPSGYEERYGEAPPDVDADRYEGPPPQGSLKDGYPVPVQPPRYGDRPPERYDDRYACLDPGRIAHRLHAGGWYDVRPVGGEGPLVRVQARRYDSSSLFLLRVDRCTGAVASARPLFLRTFAYAPRPWRRWDRWDRWGH